jgi:hypothetical protein
MFRVKDIFGKAQNTLGNLKDKGQELLEMLPNQNQSSESSRRTSNDTPTTMEQSFDANAEKTDPKMYYIIGAVVLLIIVFRKKLGIKF